MKKLFTIIFLALMTTSMFAQDNPNRMLVVQKDGNFNGYLVERLDSVVFKKVEGRIAADVVVNGFNPDGENGPEVGLTITKTENCVGFRIGLASKIMSNALIDDAAVANFLTKSGSQMYYENFEDALLSGMNMNFVPGVEYTVLTIGYDQFGIPCSSVKADFTVPEAELLGNPAVEWEVTDVQPKEITINMVPNADCYGFYICLFEPGLAEQQLNTFGPMMGFACLQDMIKAFSGQMYEGETPYTWTDLKPCSDYEIFILPVDANENYAEMVRATVSTQKVGGEGVAEVTIQFGEFINDPEYGTVQQVTFIPNDDCAAHRDLVFSKAAFDDGTWTEESVIEYMKNEKNPDYPPFYEDPYWDNYGIDDFYFKADVNTTYYGYTIGKNVNGEYGPVTKVEYTTPETCEPAATVKYMPPLKNPVQIGKPITRINAKTDYTLPGGKIIKKNLILK